MRGFVNRAIYALLAGSMLLGATLAAPSAQASQMGQAYYLYYTRITSISANCTGGNHQIKLDGYITLKPYRVYKDVEISDTSSGDIEYVHYWQDGFSSAYKQEWCRNGDYVYEYFGKHKDRREWTETFICYGGSCQFAGSIYSSWATYDWS